MRRLRIVSAVFASLFALAAPAAAHIVVVTPPGGGNGTTHWVGGGPVPGQGGALLDSPIGALPPAHANGLPHACLMTMGNDSAAVFLAPPFFTGCHHGLP